MNAFADYRMLWHAAVSQRHPKAVAVARRAVPLAMLLVALVIGAITRDPLAALAFSLRVPFAVLMFAWAVWFVPAAALLNTPANARLTPRMRIRLMQMTALAWLLTAAVPALVLGDTLAAKVGWFIAIGVWIIGLALARGGNVAGGGLQVMVIFTVLFRARLPDGVIAFASSPTGIAAGLLLLLALASLALEAVFPRGGERHLKARSKLERAVRLSHAQGRFDTSETARLGTWLYREVLRMDTARARPAALLLHVLGPTSHWSQLCLPLVALLAAGVIAKALLMMYGSAQAIDITAGIGWLFFSSILLMQQIDLERIQARLAVTRGEQSLLRMAPAAAPSAGFNRQLGRALLQHVFVDWAAISATVMALTVLSGASAHVLLMQACLCCLGLPLLAAPLRDHSLRIGMMGWILVVAAFGAALLSAGAGLFAWRFLGLPGFPVMALASMAIAALAIRWRWRTMLAAPVAFPVGRLA